MKKCNVVALICSYEDASSRAFGVIHKHKAKYCKVYDSSVSAEGIFNWAIYGFTYESQKWLTKLERKGSQFITTSFEDTEGIYQTSPLSE